MPLFNLPGLSLYFAHVPKTAGSSVEQYVSRRFGVRHSLSVQDSTVFDSRSRSGIISPLNHVTAADLVDMLPSNLDHSFALVRHPVDRIVSEYRFQQGVSWLGKLGFSTWCRVVICCMQAEPRTYDNHVRPQTDFVPEDSVVFRFEDGLDKIIVWLDDVTGTDAPPDLTMGHVNKRKTVEVQVKAQDVALIEQAFQADYRRFGYEKGDRGKLPSDPFAPLRGPFAWVIARLVILKQRLRWLR